MSQMAIELGCQWKRTWKSGFSLNWWNSRLRIASDSDFGTPTMRRVKFGLTKTDFQPVTGFVLKFVQK